MKQRKTEGFTLIELLVVIAVIAILAAILVPAVTKVITDAKWTEMKSNGKNMYVSVYADAIDSNIVGFPDGANNGTATHLYFKELAGAGTVNTAATGTKILAATPDFVSGPKRDKAIQWSSLQAKDVAWQAAKGLAGGTSTFDESTDAGTPFLVSCNWAGTTIAADTAAAGTQIVASNVANTGNESLAAGDKKVCVASFGGGASVYAVNGKDNIANLNPTGQAITLLAQ